MKKLPKKGKETPELYDQVWESASKIKFFGRYILIRYIEGLRRYLGVPAELYDIRSVGGWSPKRCLCYLFPKYTDILLVDDQRGNELTNELAYKLLERVQGKLPKVNTYILAAILCEYKAAYENRKQYVGHTIDQEPDLYDKVFNYWGQDVDKNTLWKARKALFPPEVLGEISGWNEYRKPLASVLRDYGYVWSDLRYSYTDTLKSGNFARPVKWQINVSG